MACFVNNSNTPSQQLTTELQLVSQLENNTQTELSYLSNPGASLQQKMEAYNFFSQFANHQGAYSSLNGQVSDQMRTIMMGDMQTTLQEQNNITIPTPDGGTAQITDANGNAVNMWQFVSNPNATYQFSYSMSAHPFNENQTDDWQAVPWCNGNPQDATTSFSAGPCGIRNDDAWVKHDQDGTITNANGTLNIHEHQGACQSTHEYTVSGSAKELAGYCTCSSTNPSYNTNPTQAFNNLDQYL
jgi:hypothetical protein